jgi:tRNA threonylcarbamoyladenosine biosynthesis protein TsaB
MSRELIVLGVDAAGEEPCFSAVKGQEILFSGILPDRRQTAAQLVPLLQQSLENVDLSWGNIDRLCVTVGPGSFTGIRIALATTLGLNLGANIPVLGVTTFDLWRWYLEKKEGNSFFDGVLIALSSGRQDVYGALFVRGQDGYIDMGVWSGKDLVDKLRSFDALCVIGSGQKFVLESLKRKNVIQGMSHLEPTALPLWGEQLSLEDFQQKSLKPLEPFYLKAPDVTLKK